MKLILLSKYFIDAAQIALRDFTHKQNSEINIAFCSNASDVYKDDNRVHVEISRAELAASGFKLQELDLNESLDEILRILNSVDAVFFTGGSYYKLMSLIVTSGLDMEYKGLLQEGLIHIGFSAGAMICSADFNGYDVFGVQDYRDEKIKHGLGLFHYYIIPHYYDKPKYTKAYQSVIKAGYKNVIPLTNNQAIVVNGDDWELIQ